MLEAMHAKLRSEWDANPLKFSVPGDLPATKVLPSPWSWEHHCTK